MFSGVANAFWLPDSLHIAVAFQHYYTLTIFALSDSSVSHIQNPKRNGEIHAFSRNGRLLIIMERCDYKDYIGIYKCSNGDAVKYFQIDTQECQGMASSNDNHSLIFWENFTKNKIIAYTLDGTLLYSETFTDFIRDVIISPDSTYLAVIIKDERILIVNAINWVKVIYLDYSAIPDGADIFNEVAANNGKTKYTLGSELKLKKRQSYNPSNAYKAAWSHDSRFFAFVDESNPCTLYIWDVNFLEMKAVLVQMSPIKCFCFNPNKLRLVILSGDLKVHVWAGNSAFICDIPNANKDFAPCVVSPSANGEQCLLYDKVKPLHSQAD